jgi:hypothetical protein
VRWHEPYNVNKTVSHSKAYFEKPLFRLRARCNKAGQLAQLKRGEWCFSDSVYQEYALVYGYRLLRTVAARWTPEDYEDAFAYRALLQNLPFVNWKVEPGSAQMGGLRQLHLTRQWAATEYIYMICHDPEWVSDIVSAPLSSWMNWMENLLPLVQSRRLFNEYGAVALEGINWGVLMSERSHHLLAEAFDCGYPDEEDELYEVDEKLERELGLYYDFLEATHERISEYRGHKPSVLQKLDALMGDIETRSSAHTGLNSGLRGVASNCYYAYPVLHEPEKWIYPN